MMALLISVQARSVDGGLGNFKRPRGAGDAYILKILGTLIKPPSCEVLGRKLTLRKSWVEMVEGLE